MTDRFAELFPDVEPGVPMPDFPSDPLPLAKPKIDILADIPTRPDCDVAAIEYAAAGLSVVPCALPGKYPATPWLTYQAEIADEAQIKRWYSKNPTWGLGIVCGEVSGGLEVIDLDGGEFAAEFEGLLKANAPEVFKRLVIEKSPSGGRHYAYRCETIDGNSKIAQTLRELPGHKPGTDGLTTLLETRGSGGYIVTYPTRGYVLLQGDWLHLSQITPDERNILWSLAATFDESDKAPKVPAAPVPNVKHEEPSNAAEVHALLQRHGWTLAKTSKGREDWRRPGKTDGTSATWNYLEDSFYVFSSNAAPFKDNHRYTIKQLYQLLEPDNVPQKDRPITEKCYLTDMGNARRFALRFSDQFRYTAAWGWMVWDGKRWGRDTGEKIMQAARHTAKCLFDEARDSSNPDDVKAIGKWALTSQSRGRLEAMVKLAESEESLYATAAQFDSDSFSLNTTNGIVDLRTGAIRPHEHDAMHSKITGADFRDDADCPRWAAFIDRIMGGNQSLIRFLQRAAGYSLTGSTAEQCFFLLHGTGANGKSVFLETMRAVLNDYAATAEFSTFLAKQNENVRNDIAALAGARFVASSESGADKRLSETIIKALTGGDTISARFLFKEYFEFKPQFKVWMATNHKPVIRDTDLAIWRRVRLIPFTVTIPENERNPNLVRELRDEYPAILAWAVRGCLDWQRDGLGIPDEVSAATESYRNSMDIMEAFFEDCCLRGESYVTGATPIYARYSKWCEVNNERPMTQREFSLRLGEKGFRREHNRMGSQWHGIGLILEDM